MIFKDVCDDLKEASSRGLTYLNIVEKGDKVSLKELYEDMKIIGEVEKLLFLDTETSHLNGYAVSIALILTDIEGNVLEQDYFLVNPGVKIDPETIEIHKITDEMVSKENPFSYYLDTITHYFNQADAIVAHNSLYDIGIFLNEYERLNIDFHPVLRNHIDTMKYLKQQITYNVRVKNPNLGECADMLGIQKEKEDLHNALVDTELLLEVYKGAISGKEMVLTEDIVLNNKKKEN